MPPFISNKPYYFYMLLIRLASGSSTLNPLPKFSHLNLSFPRVKWCAGGDTHQTGLESCAFLVNDPVRASFQCFLCECAIYIRHGLSPFYASHSSLFFYFLLLLSLSPSLLLFEFVDFGLQRESGTCVCVYSELFYAPVGQVSQSYLIIVYLAALIDDSMDIVYGNLASFHSSRPVPRCHVSFRLG